MGVLLSIPSFGYSQFYSGKSEEEIWEEEHNSKNDYDEILIKHAYLYDEDKGKSLADTKRELLKQTLPFYDKQLLFVNQWIEKGKCKVSKVNLDKSRSDDKTIESILFIKSLLLGSYEENTPSDVKSILDNESQLAYYKEKMKADKTYMPVVNSFKDRLYRERESIESVINKEDSVVLKFNATIEELLGLLYIDKAWNSFSTRINKNWIPQLEDAVLNKIPTKWGEVKYQNPNYNPAEGKWAWLRSDDYERVRTTYPTEEVYKKYASHPEYKVKSINDRIVVFLNDEVVYIEKGKDKKSELVRQVCIVDYQNNKYDIKKSSTSLLAKIDEMLIEGKDRMYYAGSEFAYNMAKQAFNKMMQLKRNKSLAGTMFNAMVNVPEPTEKEIADFEAKLAVLEENIEKSKLIDSDPEYKIAENYIKQLQADRENIEFKSKRFDGLSYIYTSKDSEFSIKMTMGIEGKSIKEVYEIVK